MFHHHGPLRPSIPFAHQDGTGSEVGATLRQFRRQSHGLHRAARRQVVTGGEVAQPVAEGPVRQPSRGKKGSNNKRTIIIELMEQKLGRSKISQRTRASSSLPLGRADLAGRDCRWRRVERGRRRVVWPSSTRWNLQPRGEATEGLAVVGNRFLMSKDQKRRVLSSCQGLRVGSIASPLLTRASGRLGSKVATFKRSHSTADLSDLRTVFCGLSPSPPKLCRRRHHRIQRSLHSSRRCGRRRANGLRRSRRWWTTAAPDRTGLEGSQSVRPRRMIWPPDVGATQFVI